MIVVFLDVDGVLNCSQTPARDPHMSGLDRTMVDRVVTLCDRLQQDFGPVGVVISSMWRLWPDRRAVLIHTLSDAGLFRLPHVTLLGGTPTSETWEETVGYVGGGCTTRGGEIRQWLDDHAADDISAYVILDDIADGMRRHRLTERHVMTSWVEGLQDLHVEDAYDRVSRQQQGRLA